MAIASDKVNLYNANGRNTFPFSMEGCVLYLPLWQEDMQGSTIISYDQYHHICTVTGATWGPTGRSYDGVDDLITVPAATPINNLDDITQIVWVKFNAGYGEIAPMLFNKGGSGAVADEIYILSSNGLLYANQDYVTTNAHAESSTVIATGVWTMLAKRVTSKVLDLFQDGVEVSYGGSHTTGVGNRTANAAHDLILGNFADTTQTLDGIYGEAIEFNRGLSDAEIRHIRSQTKWRYI